MILFLFMLLFFNTSLFTADYKLTNPVLLKYVYDVWEPEGFTLGLYFEGRSYKDDRLIGIALYGLLKPESIAMCDYDSYIINIVPRAGTLQTRFLML
ncbi:MAG: hypothetical protein WD055_04250 [Candidatus Dependentiae bacterium]